MRSMRTTIIYNNEDKQVSHPYHMQKIFFVEYLKKIKLYDIQICFTAAVKLSEIVVN